jgi:hypothetical protein
MPILPVTDLNLKTRICEASQEFALGVNLVRGQISVRAIDGASADPYFSTDRQTLRRRSQGSNLLLPQSANPRSGDFLWDGSWLSRLYSAEPVSPKRRLLRHSS